MAARITLIMSVFDGPSVLLTGDDVISLTKLPKSTTYRILDQLAQLNWLERSEAGYRLGYRALALGGDSGRDELRAAAAPVLNDLYDATRLVAHLAVLDGADLLYLDKIGGHCAKAIPTRVGGRAPAYWTGEGRAMLALIDPDRVAALYPNRVLVGTTMSRLQRELFRTRSRRGLTIDVQGQRRDSVVSMAMRVAGNGWDLVASLSLRGHVSAHVIERTVPRLVEGAATISKALAPNTIRR